MTVRTADAKATTVKLYHSLIKPLRVLLTNGWSIMDNSDFDLLVRIIISLICMILVIILNELFLSVLRHLVFKLFICHVFVQI